MSRSRIDSLCFVTTPLVRLHALQAGSMTSALGGFLDGEAGDITYPIMVYVIEHPSALVVVDTGLHPELASGTGRLAGLASFFEPHVAPDGRDAVGAVLSHAGFGPAEVTHAVLTHLHFDHAGGLCDLPNASVVVQSREWSVLADERLVSSGAVNPDDVDLGHLRVELDGDRDLFGDGSVTCLLTDGHTPGHQSVRVQAFDGSYLLCGDCCYLQRTLTHEHLPPFAWNHDRQRASIRRLRAEQRNGATLLFGHDPDQVDRIGRDGLSPWI